MKIGLFCSTPDGAGITRRRAQATMQWCSPARRSTPPIALDWGVINWVVPADQLEDAVGGLVAAIAAPVRTWSPRGTRAFYDQIDRGEHDAHEHTRVVVTENALAGRLGADDGGSWKERAQVWRGR